MLLHQKCHQRRQSFVLMKQMQYQRLLTSTDVGPDCTAGYGGLNHTCINNCIGPGTSTPKPSMRLGRSVCKHPVLLLLLPTPVTSHVGNREQADCRLLLLLLTGCWQPDVAVAGGNDAAYTEEWKHWLVRSMCMFGDLIVACS